MSKFSKDMARQQKDKPATAWKLTPEVLTRPPIPPPMHGLAPRVVLGRKWWDAERKAAYKSTDYHCIACGVHKTTAKNRQWLEGHEVYDLDFLLGRMEYVQTVPLCHYCHNYCHPGRLRWLVDSGKLHHFKFTAIIQHGDEVLLKAGIEKPPIVSTLAAEWSDWRLVVHNVEYPPLFTSAAEMAAHFKWKDE